LEKVDIGSVFTFVDEDTSNIYLDWPFAFSLNSCSEPKGLIINISLGAEISLRSDKQVRNILLASATDIIQKGSTDCVHANAIETNSLGHLERVQRFLVC
jgi:hypothetical protein